MLSRETLAERVEDSHVPSQRRPARLTVPEGGVPFRTSSVAESPYAELTSRRLNVEPATAETPSRDVQVCIMPKENMARPPRHDMERARAEAECLRQRAEEAREASERDRESLERIRQEEERTRHLGEADRVAAELARGTAEHGRGAALDAVRDTTLLLQATLKQMKVVEDMRRGYSATARRKRKPS